MGKKKARKIKELAVAIGEASSMGDEESGQNQSQPQTNRKRGRPRKIVEKTEEADEKKHGVEQLSDSVDAAEESLEKALEKNKRSCEQEQRDEFPQVDSSSAQEKQLPKGEPSRSRKARRKSEPRKSS